MSYRVGISGLRRGASLARVFALRPDSCLAGLCAHASALEGGQPVPVPDWR